jgi:type II pantothenate kinase
MPLLPTCARVDRVCSTAAELLEATARTISSRVHPEQEGLRHIVAAGGGAHRFARMFREVLSVALVPFNELQAAVEGLLFLSRHGPDDSSEAIAAGESELFTLDAGGSFVGCDWPRPLFPFLLVNVGSGVSVLRVESEHAFTRVGGTACGGATFLGLAKALTGTSDYHALLQAAASGDESRIDKTVADIYGVDGCADLGLPPEHTAANFGKLAAAPAARPHAQDPQHAADLVRALLRMVAQASVVLAKSYASQAGCMERVFFTGGFLQDNPLARQMIAKSMSSVGGRAIFCRHAQFLGALGSLAACMRATSATGGVAPSLAPQQPRSSPSTVLSGSGRVSPLIPR